MEEVDRVGNERSRAPGATDQATDGTSIVTVRPEIVQNLGMRTYKVARGAPPRRVVTTGYLFHDAHDSRDGGGRAASGTAAEGSASVGRSQHPASRDTDTSLYGAGSGRTPGVTDDRGMAVLVDVFDRDVNLVRPGQHAEVRVPDVPGRVFPGIVERVESDIDIGPRSLKARIRLNQPDAAHDSRDGGGRAASGTAAEGRASAAGDRMSGAVAALKPNMLAEVVIHGAPVGRQSLFIPREALIRTGRRNAVVLALGEGRFQPVDVVPGRESDDWVEIVKGIKEGDIVVTSGQFLIDSEANVRASFSRMQPPTEASGEEKKP